MVCLVSSWPLGKCRPNREGHANKTARKHRPPWLTILFIYLSLAAMSLGSLPRWQSALLSVVQFASAASHLESDIPMSVIITTIISSIVYFQVIFQVFWLICSMVDRKLILFKSLSVPIRGWKCNSGARRLGNPKPHEYRQLSKGYFWIWKWWKRPYWADWRLFGRCAGWNEAVPSEFETAVPLGCSLLFRWSHHRFGSVIRVAQHWLVIICQLSSRRIVVVTWDFSLQCHVYWFLQRIQF